MGNGSIAGGETGVSEGAGMRAMIARVVTALAFATVAVGAGGATAWATQGEGNSYVSPSFGYGLSWDPEVWEVSNEVSQDGVDSLVLQAGDGIITLILTGLPSNQDPVDCVASIAGSRLDNPDYPGYGLLEGRDQPAAGPGGAGAVFGYTLRASSGDDIPIIQYVECRPLVAGASVIAITLETVDDPDLYGAALALYAEVIGTLRVPGGGDSGTADDDASSDERDEDDDGGQRSTANDRSGVDGNVYTSPTFRYTVTWDPAVWEVVEESTEDGLDSLQVATTSGFSLVGFLASEGYGGDARGCRDDAGQILGETEGITSYTPTPNVNDGTPLIGGDSALAFAIYDAVYSDQDGTFDARVYVQCRTLVPGRAVLVVIWIVPTVAFDTDLAAFEGLLAGIDTSEAEVRETGDSDGEDQDDEPAAAEEDEDAEESENDQDREADEGDDASGSSEDEDEDEEQTDDDPAADEDRNGSGGRNSEETRGGSDDDD